MLEKKLRFTLSATNTLVVFYRQNFGEFFGSGSAVSGSDKCGSGSCLQIYRFHIPGYSPIKVAKIVAICCALHNMCRRNGAPILGANPPTSPVEITEHEIRGTTNATSALRRRQRIVEMLQPAT